MSIKSDFINQTFSVMAATLEAAGDIIKGTNPSRRIGTPEDVVGASLFLSGRSGAWINGAVLPVDGGHLVVSKL